MKRKTAIFLALGMAAGLTVLGGCGTGNKSDIVQEEAKEAEEAEETAPAAGGEYRSVTVNSSETVSVVPDMAEVVYSVRTGKSTAAECQRQNSESVAQVIELLKGLGVEERSIQTSDFSMRPVYNYSGSTARITGYEAETSLTVSDLKIDGLSELLSQSVASGINTVESITYQASGYDESYREALAKAMSAAYEKAGVLAAASGAKVGRVIAIQETSGYTQERYTDSARANGFNAMKEMSLEAAEDMAEMMPGEVAVKASVTVEYELTD